MNKGSNTICKRISQVPKNEHNIAIYQKKLLLELGKEGKKWYEKPYDGDEKLYKRYDDQYWERKQVFANVVQKFHVTIRENKHQEFCDLIYNIFTGDTTPEFLSLQKRKFIFERLSKFRNERERVYNIYEKYCNNTNDAELFLRGVAPWLTGRRFIDKMNMYLNGFGVDIYCANEKDYVKIAGEGSKKLEKEFLDTKGATRYNNIKPRTIKNLIRVYNGVRSAKTSTIYKHETQHMINQLFMPKIISPYEKCQDEIIAYVRDGTIKDYVLKALLGKSAMYDFYLDANNKPLNPKTYYVDHDKYFLNVLKYVGIIFELKSNSIDNYLNILIVTPIHDRPKLKKYLLG